MSRLISQEASVFRVPTLHMLISTGCYMISRKSRTVIESKSKILELIFLTKNSVIVSHNRSDFLIKIFAFRFNFYPVLIDSGPRRKNMTTKTSSFVQRRRNRRFKMTILKLARRYLAIASFFG